MFDIGDTKVRDYCHITRKCRGSAQWSCNINLKLTKKVPAVKRLWQSFNHVIVISNGLEKHKAFRIIKIWFLLIAFNLWILV